MYLGNNIIIYVVFIYLYYIYILYISEIYIFTVLCVFVGSMIFGVFYVFQKQYNLCSVLYTSVISVVYYIFQ